MNQMNAADLKNFLDEKLLIFQRRSFIEQDPVSIPHLFSKKEDIEIAGFLSATIAWGQRKTILKNARQLVKWMDDDPYHFITGFEAGDLTPFKKFVHRTFQPEDCIFFLKSLQNIYRNHGGLSQIFQNNCSKKDSDTSNSIHSARYIFFESSHLKRSQKHFPDPIAGSAAKRINMFLRWMVRDSRDGVDFGIWKKVKTSQLICPLDVHSGRVARKLGLLKRNQNDWQAAKELTDNLKKFDSSDPVKYDFALFGLGAIEGF